MAAILVLFPCKLVHVASLKENILLNFEFKNEATTKLTQEKIEFGFEFCNFVVRFSVYCLAFCFEFYNHHIHKAKQQKTFL